MKPYLDKEIETNVVIREFDGDTSESSLVWHRDNEDRIVEVIGETDWMFQRDNELPIKMEGKIEIPRHQWHRAIKGNGKLVLKITKKQFDLLSESFKQPEGSGVNSSWGDEIGGKIVKITFDDVIEQLDNGFEIDPNKIKHLLIDVERDPKRIDNADLKYPIILIKSGGEFIRILDGQHRVVKAIKNGMKIRVRILDLDLAPEIFTKIFKY